MRGVKAFIDTSTEWTRVYLGMESKRSTTESLDSTILKVDAVCFGSTKKLKLLIYKEKHEFILHSLHLTQLQHSLENECMQLSIPKLYFV